MELLAVVTILGILAIVIIPRIGGHTRTAKQNVCHQYVGDLNTAIELYYLENGSWPSTVDELHPDFYPDTIPTCPVLNHAYSVDAATNRIADCGHP